MPNQPNTTTPEEELRYALRHTKVTAYADGKPYDVKLSTVIQSDDIGAIMQLIKDYIKKRDAFVVGEDQDACTKTWDCPCGRKHIYYVNYLKENKLRDEQRKRAAQYDGGEL